MNDMQLIKNEGQIRRTLESSTRQKRSHTKVNPFLSKSQRRQEPQATIRPEKVLMVLTFAIRNRRFSFASIFLLVMSEFGVWADDAKVARPLTAVQTHLYRSPLLLLLLLY